jgi:hypothetical protein
MQQAEAKDFQILGNDLSPIQPSMSVSKAALLITSFLTNKIPGYRQTSNLRLMTLKVIGHIPHLLIISIVAIWQYAYWTGQN